MRPASASGEKCKYSRSSCTKRAPRVSLFSAIHLSRSGLCKVQSHRLLVFFWGKHQNRQLVHCGIVNDCSIPRSRSRSRCSCLLVVLVVPHFQNSSIKETDIEADQHPHKKDWRHTVLRADWPSLLAGCHWKAVRVEKWLFLLGPRAGQSTQRKQETSKTCQNWALSLFVCARGLSICASVSPTISKSVPCRSLQYIFYVRPIRSLCRPPFTKRRAQFYRGTGSCRPSPPRICWSLSSKHRPILSIEDSNTMHPYSLIILSLTAVLSLLGSSKLCSSFTFQPISCRNVGFHHRQQNDHCRTPKDARSNLATELNGSNIISNGEQRKTGTANNSKEKTYEHTLAILTFPSESMRYDTVFLIVSPIFVLTW